MTDCDYRALREAFGTFMTGVTIVTTRMSDGTPRGFTANSFTSVSLEPPLLLVCVGKQVGSLDAYIKGSSFAVNILAEEQRETSNIFATPDIDRFANTKWQEGPNGNPILAGSNAWFDCSVHQVIEAGDHYILIGHVDAFDRRDANGLGYINGSYFTVSDELAAISAAESHTQINTGAVIESDNHVLLLDDSTNQLVLPKTKADNHDRSISALKELLVELNITAPIGSIYAVYEHNNIGAYSLYYHVLDNDIDIKGKRKQGTFFPINAIPFERISDDASKNVLERFSSEHNLQRYGIYISSDGRDGAFL